MLRYVKVEVEKKTALNSLTSLREELATSNKRLAEAEADLKIEKEWRQRLQASSQTDKEALEHKRLELDYLQSVSNVSRFYIFSIACRN